MTDDTPAMQPVDDSEPDGDETPATTGAVLNKDKTVTFTCVAADLVFKDWNKDGAVVSAAELKDKGIWVKGSVFNPSWGKIVELTEGEAGPNGEEGKEGVWRGTTETAVSPGKYEYLFAGGSEKEDNITDTTGSNRTLVVPGWVMPRLMRRPMGQLIYRLNQIHIIRRTVQRYPRR